MLKLISCAVKTFPYPMFISSCTSLLYSNGPKENYHIPYPHIVSSEFYRQTKLWGPDFSMTYPGDTKVLLQSTQ